MNPIEIVGEICTLDSAFIRGWRWLFSTSYRKATWAKRKEQRTLFLVAGIAETLLLMIAEVIAVFFVIRWLLSV